MYNYFKKSRPSSYGEAGTAMDAAIRMAVLAQSSRLRKLPGTIRGLNFHKIDLPTFQASIDLPADKLDVKTKDAIVKSCIEKEFDAITFNETLALENHEILRKSLEKFCKTSPPVEEYRPVCDKFHLTMDEYMKVEQFFAKYLLSPDSLYPENRLMMNVSVQTTTGCKLIVVPEPVVLKLVSDVRRERAAQGRSRH